MEYELQCYLALGVVIVANIIMIPIFIFTVKEMINSRKMEKKQQNRKEKK